MPSPPAAGDEVDLDALRQLARDLVDASPDNQSAAAERIGVYRSSVSRALSPKAQPLPDVLGKLVAAYSDLEVDPEPVVRYRFRAKGGG